MNLDTLWNTFLEEMKENVSSLSYDTWFRDTKLVSLHNNIASVIVPMPVHKKHLIDNYKDVIENKFMKLSGTNFTFNFLLQDEWDKLKESYQQSNEKEEKKERIPKKIEAQTFEDANLNKEYTFDNFIVGSSNRFAFTASVKSNIFFFLNATSLKPVINFSIRDNV